MFRRLVFGLVAASVWVWTGCDDSSQKGDAGRAGSTQPSAALPSGLIVAQAPAQPRNVVEARQQAKAGDEIVVQGRIGGRVEPFVAGRAIFQLVDSSLPACDANADDHCQTPWDYCCEPPDQIAAKSLTVQVVGEDGKPLRVDLNGQGGLKPAARVVVKGTVTESSDEKTMIVRAESVYVQPDGPKGS